jgi:hypothetical protein
MIGDDFGGGDIKMNSDWLEILTKFNGDGGGNIGAD